MAISVTNVGTVSSSSGATAAIAVPVGGVPAGANIFVCVCENAASIGGSVADTNNTPYLATTGAFKNNVSSNGFGRLFYFENATALVSGNSITYTKVGTGNVGASAFYATGLAASSSIDSGVTASATGSSTAPSATGGSGSQSGSLNIGIVYSGSAGTFTQDTGHGWAVPPTQVIGGVGASQRVNGGNQVNSGTSGITYAPTIPNGVWAAFVFGFKIPAVAAKPFPPFQRWAA